MLRKLVITTAIVMLTVACAPNEPDTTPVSTERSAVGDATQSEPGPTFQVPLPSRELYDPVRAGEQLPQGYRRSLDRDAIFPVYDPSFVGASQVDWDDDILVIGVKLDGEARAYPVGFLNRREIVIDHHRGIPTLVTW